MTVRPMTRRLKVATVVPVALVSGVWTAHLVTSTSIANASAPTSTKKLPDGTSVPTKAIEAPASVPVPGVVAPAVPQGGADAAVAGASTTGIPAPALAGYQRAAQIIDSADKTCNIPWELIAAIGRVESDHGRYGGNTLSDKGESQPGIYGPELNGKGGTQAIKDTDGGDLDKDPVFDRAVGPMQFIPSTWQVVKVDADGDGTRDPQNINDASLATGVYLCSGGENLANRPGQQAAVLRYNHSQDYVNLVLRIMEAYSQGDFSSIPSGTQGGTIFSPSSSAQIGERRQAAHQRQVAAQQQKARQQAAGGGSGSTGATSSAGTPLSSTSGGSSTPQGGQASKPVQDGVKKAAGGVASAAQGAGGAVTNTLTQAAATTQCLAQVGASSVTTIDPLKLTTFNSCMSGLGF